MQSSWFLTTAFLMVTPVDSLISNPSVLWPPLSSPSEFLKSHVSNYCSRILLGPQRTYIDRDPINHNIVRLDAERLHGGVLDGQARDSRVVQRVGIEELRLGLAAVGALAIPPAGTIGVDDGAIGCLNGDTGSRDLDERATPLFVAESSGSLKEDLELSQELGQRDAGRHEGLYVIKQVREGLGQS